MFLEEKKKEKKRKRIRRSAVFDKIILKSFGKQTKEKDVVFALTVDCAMYFIIL